MNEVLNSKCIGGGIILYGYLFVYLFICYFLSFVYFFCALFIDRFCHVDCPACAAG